MTCYRKETKHKLPLHWPGIERGSTAWKAAMLTTIPPMPAWMSWVLFMLLYANSQNFSVVYLFPCWGLTTISRVNLWLVGLGVWFSLRVREVPGSNPGRALIDVMQLCFCCEWLNFLAVAIVSTLRNSEKCPHNVTCINPLTTCLAPVELTVWAFLSPQRTCYMFWNFHGLDFFF